MREKITRSIAVATGIIFILTGAFKLLLPAGSTPGAPRAFAAFLMQLGVPFPTVMGTAIPLLEVVGGLGLIARRGARVWAALLALDMMGAILLVGVPGKFGKSVRIGEHAIGREAWRLPLEIALLAAMVWLAISPSRRASEDSSKPEKI